ncbi:hypothetical protein BC941DRAFT_439890 [Chlamydoabsidia padenii]|nr:hypothetical protein BC941DRAFT_439890 [Chlamydoabsidia padenii]
MTTSKVEESPLYSLISFLVVWTDYIVRTYIRIKAAFDAVVYVAQSPITPRQQRKSSVSSESPKLHRPPSPTPSHHTTTFIFRLPNEVMQAVFTDGGDNNDLVQYTLVCQRWHRLVTPLLWKAPILSPSILGPVGTNYTPPHDSTTITTNAPSRHRRTGSTLSRDGRISSSRILRSFRLAKYGHAVQTLRLGSISEQVTDDLLLYITQHCPNLIVLDLSHCHQLGPSGYQHLARSKCTSSLIQLNLSHGKHLTDSALVSLSMRCDSLEIIHLAGCHQITQMGVRSLAAACRQSLQYINMKDCIKLSGHILQDLAILCGPRLVGVDATRICSILHSDIKVLVQHCPRLEQLYVGQNKSQLLCQLQQRIRNDEQQQQQDIWESPPSSPLPANNKRGRRRSNNIWPLSPSTSSVSLAPHPFTTSLSASLLQQRQLSRSKSSSQYNKPNALDSLLDMLQHYNVDSADQQHQQRVHRSRHLSQPGWQSNNNNNNNNSISNIISGMDNSKGMYRPLQDTDQVSQATVEMMMKHLKHLKAVDFSHWNCLTDQLVRKLRKGRTIQYIGLEGCLAVSPSIRCE